MKWATAIITAPREPSWLAATLSSVAEAGWDNPLVVAEPDSRVPPSANGIRVFRNPHRLGPHRNFRRALSILLEADPHADAYGIFQDDIQLTGNLKAWLDLTGVWPSDRAGVLSLFTASVNHSTKPGWNVCEDVPRRAYGAQAYVFRPRAAAAYLSTAPRQMTWGQNDYWVGWWCRESGYEYWIHSPSFVRHLGNRSTVMEQSLDEFRQCRAFVTKLSRVASVSPSASTRGGP